MKNSPIQKSFYMHFEIVGNLEGNGMEHKPYYYMVVADLVGMNSDSAQMPAI